MPRLTHLLFAATLASLQIRNGGGAMPRFSSNEITDEQVSAVTAYLEWLRRQH